MKTAIVIETKPLHQKTDDHSQALANKLHLLVLSRITKELSEMDTEHVLLDVKISR
jgi:hypothetical protein